MTKLWEKYLNWLARTYFRLKFFNRRYKIHFWGRSCERSDPDTIIKVLIWHRSDKNRNLITAINLDS